MRFLLKFWTCIFALLVTAAFAQGAGSSQSGNAAADSAQVQGIIFNGVVQDSSFAAGEKLNVEILESGEALQTTVGTPFSIVLPEDTLWNVCVTNSDTAGAERKSATSLYIPVPNAAFRRHSAKRLRNLIAEVSRRMILRVRYRAVQLVSLRAKRSNPLLMIQSQTLIAPPPPKRMSMSTRSSPQATTRK